jgi:hypothetical protein
MGAESGSQGAGANARVGRGVAAGTNGAAVLIVLSATVLIVLSAAAAAAAASGPLAPFCFLWFFSFSHRRWLMTSWCLDLAECVKSEYAPADDSPSEANMWSLGEISASFKRTPSLSKKSISPSRSSATMTSPPSWTLWTCSPGLSLTTAAVPCIKELTELSNMRFVCCTALASTLCAAANAAFTEHDLAKLVFLPTPKWVAKGFWQSTVRNEAKRTVVEATHERFFRECPSVAKALAADAGVLFGSVQVCASEPHADVAYETDHAPQPCRQDWGCAPDSSWQDSSCDSPPSSIVASPGPTTVQAAAVVPLPHVMPVS